MTEEKKKIEALEEQLNQLARQIDQYKAELNQLKKTPNTLSNDSLGIPSQDPNSEIIVEKKSSPAYLENFIGVKLLHLTGIVVLVIGISIGVKYAVDKELISPLTRILLAYTAGILLYILSVRLKEKFQLFSAILFSGAMASLYFTTYAAFIYYQMFPLLVAFITMVVITVYTAYSAIKYDRQEIALLGMTGSYGIPFLISSNSGRVEMLFAYIILINAGVVFLSYKKSWKAMVRSSIVATWMIFILWAGTKYDVRLQSAAITFMTVFYVMFALASVGFAILKKQVLALLDIHLFLLNSVLAYLAALLVFGDGNLDREAVPVTGAFCILFALQAVGTRSFFSKEKLLFNYLTAFSLTGLVRLCIDRFVAQAG